TPPDAPPDGLRAALPDALPLRLDHQTGCGCARTARCVAGGTTGRAAVAAEPPDVPRPYRQTLCGRHRETRHGCCRTARRVAPGTTKHAATAVLRSTAGIPTIRSSGRSCRRCALCGTQLAPVPYQLRSVAIRSSSCSIVAIAVGGPPHAARSAAWICPCGLPVRW